MKYHSLIKCKQHEWLSKSLCWMKNQTRIHIVWFHLIKFQKIQSIFTEKEKKRERERCTCQEKKMGGGMNYKGRWEKFGGWSYGNGFILDLAIVSLCTYVIVHMVDTPKKAPTIPTSWESSLSLPLACWDIYALLRWIIVKNKIWYSNSSICCQTSAALIKRW